MREGNGVCSVVDDINRLAKNTVMVHMQLNYFKVKELEKKNPDYNSKVKFQL